MLGIVIKGPGIKTENRCLPDLKFLKHSHPDTIDVCCHSNKKKLKILELVHVTERSLKVSVSQKYSYILAPSLTSVMHSPGFIIMVVLIHVK